MSKRLKSLIERARLIIEEPDIHEEQREPSYEIHVFDFDQTLHHNYKALPCIEIFRENLAAGMPCYIVTAREPNAGHEQHICDFLFNNNIVFYSEDVYAAGKNQSKGKFVANLIQRHAAEKCVFWDDKDYNCESVFETCKDLVEELQIFHLSSAIPGDIRKEIRKDSVNYRHEIKHSLHERKLFRRWRKLGKV